MILTPSLRKTSSKAALNLLDGRSLPGGSMNSDRHSINVLELRGEARNESTIGSAVADAVELCAVLCGELDEADRVRLELAIRETFLSTVQPVLADVGAWLPKESRIGQVLSRWVQGSLGQIFSRPTNGRLDAGMIEPRGL